MSSRLDYANSLLYGVNSSQIQRLQRVQNRAAKLIVKARKRDHVTPLLKQLHWLPIKQRILFKIMTAIYKCLQNKAPTYQASLIVPRHYVRSGLRSSSDNTLLHVPRTYSAVGDNAFQAHAPRLWNELPQYIRLSPSLDAFRKALKTHLFEQ